jgi:thiamine-phosphate pyrophosphorylase
MKDFGLYLVMTDPVVGYVKCAEAAVKAGVGIIQLRMKHAARAEVLAQAREIRKATAGSRTLFIVNDDPAIAEESGADGVHVGQDDMPPAEVRAKFPGLKIVGLSTHNVSQVEASLEQDVDYIGVGPVFATPTKDVPDPVLGLETMARMIDLAKCPAVAIGGIDASRVDVVRTAGARNWAVVRAVCQSADPYRAILALMR